MVSSQITSKSRKYHSKLSTANCLAAGSSEPASSSNRDILLASRFRCRLFPAILYHCCRSSCVLLSESIFSRTSQNVRHTHTSDASVFEHTQRATDGELKMLVADPTLVWICFKLQAHTVYSIFSTSPRSSLPCELETDPKSVYFPKNLKFWIFQR